jgi:conjugal transfer/entry exclusion protein
MRHQTSAQADAVAEIKKELQRFSNRLTRIDENMREYQDTASEKYVPATIYNRDLKNWSDTFQEVRTSLRDLSAILVRMLETREGRN